MKMWDRT